MGKQSVISYLRKILRPIAKCNPVLASVFRAVSDEMQFRQLKFVTTPFGFHFIGDEAMQTGKFEPDETSFVLRHLKDVDVFVDVGANIGYYSCLARSAGKSVMAFEPIPSNLRLLYCNLERNGWSDVEVFPIGLAEIPQVATIYGTGTGASLVEGWGTGTYRHQKIAVNKLDNIIDARFSGKRMLIKVDVEGAEWQVLNGAEKLLASSPRPIWLIEIMLVGHHSGMNLHFAEIFEKFWSNGYEARTADEQERLVTPTDVKKWVSKGTVDRDVLNWIFL